MMEDAFMKDAFHIKRLLNPGIQGILTEYRSKT